MRRMLAPLAPLIVVLILLTAPAVLAAHTVTVWSGDLDGWTIRTTDGGSPPDTASVTFVAGPATAPLGTGSAQLAVGTNGAGAAEVRNGEYAGTQLANITALSYWTYVSAPGSGGQAPYLILAVDLSGDGTSDDLLFFEPNYQDGSYSGDPVPNQGTLTTGTWQQWDARAGGWWSLNAGTFGPPLVTLDSYVAANPGATLVNEAAGGGLRVVAGFGAGAWDNFVGNVDAIVIGTTAHTTTYDMEVAPAVVPATPTPTPTATPSPTPAASALASPTPAPAASQLPDTATAPAVGTGVAAILVILVAILATARRRSA